MAKLPICPYCLKEVAKSYPSKKYQERTYHLDCYKKHCEEIYKLKTSNSKKQKNAEELLYKYICKLFGIPEMTNKLIAQLKSLFSEHHYTYGGVLLSLKYFYEIKDNKPDIKYGVGIVPYIYEEAKDFYSLKKQLEKKEKNFSCPEGKTITIKEKKKNKKKKLINIENL
jgi:hypothetical protein